MAKQDLHEELLLDAWRDQVGQSLGEQQVGRDLGRASAGANEDFLDSLFFYYGEVQRAREGKVVRKALQEEWIGLHEITSERDGASSEEG